MDVILIESPLHTLTSLGLVMVTLTLSQHPRVGNGFQNINVGLVDGLWRWHLCNKQEITYDVMIAYHSKSMSWIETTLGHLFYCSWLFLSVSVAVSLVSQDTQMPRFVKHRSCSLSSELPTDTDTLDDVAQYFISMSDLNTNPLVLFFIRPRSFVLMSQTHRFSSIKFNKYHDFIHDCVWKTNNWTNAIMGDT